jgi:hypothetical protein
MTNTQDRHGIESLTRGGISGHEKQLLQIHKGR